MKKLQNWMISLKHSEQGQGMVEYGLIIALVAIGLVVTLGLLTDSLDGIFTSITNTLNPPA